MMTIEINIPKRKGPTGKGRRPRGSRIPAVVLAALALWGWGCSLTPLTRHGDAQPTVYPVGTVVSASLAAPVPLSALIGDLAAVSVVYLGETHTDPAHHQVQVTVLQQLLEKTRPLVIGLEMVDRSYQQVLDAWTAGAMDWPEFLRATHWYANWRYPDSLYADILALAKERRIAVVGLNIPFHIPAKISIGGIGSLTEGDRIWLPESIDTADAAHRDYVRKVFEAHRLPGRDDFEFFYTAQCVWEDTMAESIARHASAERTMVVIIGNGHIVNRFGVPARAARRTGLPYRTVIPIAAGQPIDLSEGDYFWVTEPPEHPKMGGRP